MCLGSGMLYFVLWEIIGGLEVPGAVRLSTPHLVTVALISICNF